MTASRFSSNRTTHRQSGYGAFDFSLLPGRVSLPKLADRTFERRTDLAHSGPRQLLHVSYAKRLPARRQIERDFAGLRERARGPAIRARLGGSGREDPL